MSLEPVPRARDYETSQLIPYLGNKRSLVPRLRELFERLKPERGECVFLDPFVGAGSVSRLARGMGLRVRANDWEPYSFVLSRAWLGLRPSDLDGMFRAEGGVDAELARLNAFHPSRENHSPDPEPEPYMARWYAPHNTVSADWRTERLFYTRENAIFLDRVRGEIARKGLWDDTEAAARGDPCPKSTLFLALLLLEAATHANTSGVFKAFHKGFGGHGRDALPRILGAMELERPLLAETEPALVFREDASRFARRFSSDIAYLDPPYNQHQYGSNYHLLNTLVRWDGAAVPLDVGSDGRLLRKAGIPALWRETWSAYCGRQTAREALRSLLDNLDTRTLVLSYNTEGIVPPEELFEMLASRWDVRTEILDYIRYRGGRQSSARRVRNHELVYVGLPRPAVRHATGSDGPRRLTAELRLRKLLTARFDPERILRNFRIESDSIVAAGDAKWHMWRFYRFFEPRDVDTGALRSASLDRVLSILESCEIRENFDAVRTLVSIAKKCMAESSPDAIADARRASREALTALRKLAHPKYVSEYRTAEAWCKDLARENAALRERMEAGLQRLDAVRAARLEGARKAEIPRG